MRALTLAARVQCLPEGAEARQIYGVALGHASTWAYAVDQEAGELDIQPFRSYCGEVPPSKKAVDRYKKDILLPAVCAAEEEWFFAEQLRRPSAVPDRCDATSWAQVATFASELSKRT
jgi:hypothetical protein